MRTPPDTPLADLLNLGPASASRLAAVGLHTRADLEAVGPVVAYRLARDYFPADVTLNLLYALHGALAGVRAEDLSDAERARLRADAEGLRASDRPGRPGPGAESPVEPRISMVTLGVHDVSVAAAFYARLGWQRRESPPDIAFFALEGAWLSLYSHNALAEDATVEPGAPPAFRGVALAHNVRSQVEVDRVLAHAVAAGATLVKPAGPVFWGGYSGYFADPDGHLWEVAFNPYEWIGPGDADADGDA